MTTEITRDFLLEKIQEIYNENKEDNENIKLLKTKEPTIKELRLEDNWVNLGVDSLNTYEMIYQVEEDLGIRIEDTEAVKFDTIGDTINYLFSRKDEIENFLKNKEKDDN